MNEEDLDLNGTSIPQDDDVYALPIYSMKEHFCSPWDNEEQINLLVFKLLDTLFVISFNSVRLWNDYVILNVT